MGLRNGEKKILRTLIRGHKYLAIIREFILKFCMEKKLEKF